MSEGADRKRHQVLLAEDDEISQEIVCALLQDQEDIELTVVVDGKSALEAALKQRFDLLIVDQNLPFITGDRVIRHLRAGSTKNSETPVMRLSAEIGAPSVRHSNGFPETLMPKPLASEIFISTIRAILVGEEPTGYLATPQPGDLT
jgi:CheY-like chemotaxis protein